MADIDYTIQHSKLPTDSKVPGVYYMAYLDKDTNKVVMTPTSPPSTTWSGILACPADSPYAERLTKKCGGTPFVKDGNDWVAGFWTAPKDWTEMAAGRESPRLFSSKTHAAKDFPFLSLKA